MISTQIDSLTQPFTFIGYHATFPFQSTCGKVEHTHNACTLVSQYTNY